MSTPEQKIAQYLNEAHAMEQAAARTLEAQIAMTPRGKLRTALEDHHSETVEHAERVTERLAELSSARHFIRALLGVPEAVVAQTVALAKTPLDLVRGASGEEKVLKNAKDACATEALEVATYTALEELARAVGDQKTAKLAKEIRAQEQRMLDKLQKELPALTQAMVRAEIDGESSFDVTKTGAADAARKTKRAATTQAKRAGRATTKRARKVPGEARAEGRVRGTVASAADLPIANYDDLSAESVTAKLRGLSQLDLATIEAYERRQQARSTVLERIDTLQGNEPWAGYDELNVDEVQAALGAADEKRARFVRTYERAHKDRAGVVEAAERKLSTA